MKERPILFSGPMVRAILAGTKTQTRRVAHVPEGASEVRPSIGAEAPRGSWVAHWRGPDGEESGGTILRCPYGEPGDVLWVRETWAAHWMYDDCAPSKIGRKAANGLWFRAEGEGQGLTDRGRWRPSIHMPRWACRLRLRVTDVRVERVQDISEHDAMWEGCEPSIDSKALRVVPAREAFAGLWDSINGKREGCSWADNPWTWMVAFERMEGP